MNALMENVSVLWDRLLALFSSYNIITDTLDIAFVAFLVFSAIKMLKETRGIQIVKGLVIVAVIYAIISLLNMQASILFTPEIRHALETMGRSRFAFLNFFGAQQGDALYERKKRAVLEICKACRDMSDKKIGALIIFERNTMLGDIINTGTVVDAKVSRELINALFFPNSALHDGGVVIRDGRVVAAGCILPLTDNNSLSSELGTRHRASLGISEKSDAVAVVVSEETGKISIACGGELERGVSDGILMERLMDYILPDNANKEKKSFFSVLLTNVKEKFKK